MSVRWLVCLFTCLPAYLSVCRDCLHACRRFYRIKTHEGTENSCLHALTRDKSTVSAVTLSYAGTLLSYSIWQLYNISKIMRNLHQTTRSLVPPVARGSYLTSRPNVKSRLPMIAKCHPIVCAWRDGVSWVNWICCSQLPHSCNNYPVSTNTLALLNTTMAPKEQWWGHGRLEDGAV